jgi:hypothetical protein
MARFHFFFFDTLGAPKASADADRASDSDAVAEAERCLVERRELAAVEIWRGSKLVQGIKRSGERWVAEPIAARLSLHPLFEPSLGPAM